MHTTRQPLFCTTKQALSYSTLKNNGRGLEAKRCERALRRSIPIAEYHQQQGDGNSSALLTTEDLLLCRSHSKAKHLEGVNGVFLLTF